MEKLQTLLTALDELSAAPAPLELRETFCVIANQAFEDIAAAAPDERGAAEVRLRAALRDADQQQDPFWLTLIHSLLYASNGNVAHLLAAIKTALIENITDVGVGMNNIYLITRLYFLDRVGPNDLNGIFDYECRHHYWLKLVELGRQVIASAGATDAAGARSNDRALVLIEQFLQPPHAPTKDALEFGRMFQDIGGMQVMIVSTCALGRQLYSAIMPGSLCNVNDALKVVPEFEFEGRAFKYHQPQSGRFNNQTLIDTLRVIEAFDPAFVLVIGQQNLVGEMLAPGRFLNSIPHLRGLADDKGLPLFYLAGAKRG